MFFFASLALARLIYKNSSDVFCSTKVFHLAAVILVYFFVASNPFFMNLEFNSDL